MNISKSINNENNPLRSIKDIQCLIIHHTGNNSDGNKDYLNRIDYVSAHYLIDNSGAIWQLMDLNRIAYHAGLSHWEGLEAKMGSLNWNSIGIEVTGSKNDFTPAQQESIFKLVDYLRKKFEIKDDHILRHKDVSPGRKIDPDDSLFGKWNNDYKEFLYDIISSDTEYDDEMGTYIKETDMKLSKTDYKGIFDEYFEGPLMANWDGENPMSEGQIKALLDVMMKKFIRSDEFMEAVERMSPCKGCKK